MQITVVAIMCHALGAISQPVCREETLRKRRLRNPAMTLFSLSEIRRSEYTDIRKTSVRGPTAITANGRAIETEKARRAGLFGAAAGFRLTDRVSVPWSRSRLKTVPRCETRDHSLYVRYGCV
jgi:hypothetical protein